MLKNFSLVMMLLLIVASSGYTVAQEASPAIPTLDELEAGWNTIYPAGDTSCALGTPYSFHVRPGDSSDLLVFLTSGGACWNPFTCNPDSPLASYLPIAEVDENDPRTYNGIFDFSKTENPFLDYTMIFIPYCTGDGHIGATAQVYEVAGAGGAIEDLTVYHNGYANATSALDWAFANIDNPDRVFVTGSSAGGNASPLYAGLLATEYPDSQIVQLGDSGGAFGGNMLSEVLMIWGTPNILPEWFTYDDAEPLYQATDLYTMTSAAFPNIQYAQYNAANDQIALQFLALLGVTGVSVQEMIETNLAAINESVAGFRSYTAGGPVHVIMGRRAFYELEVEGVRLVDWVTALANGEPVENITCQGDACLVNQSRQSEVATIL